MEFILNVQNKSIKKIAECIGYSLLLHPGKHHEYDFYLTRRIGELEHPHFHLRIVLIDGGEVGDKFDLSLCYKKPEHPDACHYKHRGNIIKEEALRIQRAIDAPQIF
jgi:hypothetical protein